MSNLFNHGRNGSVNGGCNEFMEVGKLLWKVEGGRVSYLFGTIRSYNYEHPYVPFSETFLSPQRKNYPDTLERMHDLYGLWAGPRTVRCPARLPARKCLSDYVCACPLRDPLTGYFYGDDHRFRGLSGLAH